MTAGLIAAIVILGVVLIVLARSVRIVPQARAAVIERLGRYIRTATPGLTLLVPFVDRMRPMIDLREQVVSFPPQPVITSDNLTVGVDSVIYFQVNDARAATYEIANYIQAVEQLTITTLRNVIGSLNLEQALTSRDEINGKLRGVLDEATGPWGIRVARVEIKAIDPPPSIQDAMEQQMRADRNKRALILTAEGQRESAIKTAEGNKAAQILDAEGQKQAAILGAEADRQSRILKAEGERAARYLAAQGQAKAIETTFNAIHAAKPDPALLAYQYLQTLPQIAQGDANKMWIVPSEFSKALDGLAKLTGGDGEDAPNWLAQQSSVDATGGPIDTSDWFDSNLPPAAEQPEAQNLRASDDDVDSVAARMGMPDITFGSSAVDDEEEDADDPALPPPLPPQISPAPQPPAPGPRQGPPPPPPIAPPPGPPPAPPSGGPGLYHGGPPPGPVAPQARGWQGRGPAGPQGYRPPQAQAGPILRGLPSQAPVRQGPPRQGPFRQPSGQHFPGRQGAVPPGPFRPPRQQPPGAGPTWQRPQWQGPGGPGPAQQRPPQQGPPQQGPPRRGPVRQSPPPGFQQPPGFHPPGAPARPPAGPAPQRPGDPSATPTGPLPTARPAGPAQPVRYTQRPPGGARGPA